VKTILLIDDEPAFRDIFQRYLETRGYTILAAADTLEAQTILALPERRIDLIVLDLILKHEDSRVFAERLRAERPELPILFVSAGRHQHVIDFGLLKPEDAFLEKPFSLSVLEKTVESLLKSSTHRRESP
jgi:DNA-binding response OmpR family regulator